MERLTEINKLRNVASYWLYFANTGDSNNGFREGSMTSPIKGETLQKTRESVDTVRNQSLDNIKELKINFNQTVKSMPG